MEPFIKGMDLSALLEVEECGGTFSDHGVAGDAMEILQRYGMNLLRLRLWNDPYSEEGVPYGAGTNDLSRTMILARRAKRLGIDWLLDIHYSDFWVDPAKQTLPKAWQGMNEEELEQAVYQYTFSVMTVLKETRLLPVMVAIGNEISCGLLWPYGKIPNFDNIVRFINAGIRAVHQVDASIPIMLHLDNGSSKPLYEEWFTRYFAAGGEDFEYIGLSYYPFWNGSLEELKENLDAIALRFHKDLIVAEVSTGFTLEDYQQYEQLPPDQRKGMATKPEIAAKVPYPMTPQGQSDFMQDLMEKISQVPDGRGKGFIYWEPAWIPVPGSQWATEEAIAYMKEKGPGGNEWANQALFDYEGRTLPALETIHQF